MLDLPAESTIRVPHHGDREAPFAVDEADDPLLETWPFLLIVRTGRIVTVHVVAPYEGGVTMRTSTARYTGFPAFGRLHLPRSLSEGAAQLHSIGVYLRTVIVTAAVYRGLGSELRLAANPSP